MNTPDPADVHTTEHDHTGPDSACPACKPLADVLRDRMRWPSMHWGELHPDAYASLARAVHAAGYQLPVHTGTDRVELTDADIEQLADDLCRWHEDPDEVGDYTAPCDACRVQARCIAPFVAARMQALTAEDRTEPLQDALNATVAQRDAARAELAAANARCTELEERLRETNEDADSIDERLTQASRDCLQLRNERNDARQLLADIEDRVARNQPWMPSYVEAMKRLRKATAENAALQETLDRVTAVLDEYCTAGCCQHAESNEKQLHDLLRAALTPEGSVGLCQCGHPQTDHEFSRYECGDCGWMKCKRFSPSVGTKDGDDDE